jgi:4-hydroxy-tetrahydrodipicolinate reductase
MKIILAGLPGKIASVVANSLPAATFHSHALCSSRHATTQWIAEATAAQITLVTELNLAASLMQGEEYVALDFSPVAAGPDRLAYWASLKVPAVIGATGFDAKDLRERIPETDALIVIAPNLALPIVAIQAALKDAAQHYSGAFAGFKFRCEESHQATKKDTSGTARSLIPVFRDLGFQGAEEKSIVSIRDPALQRQRGVPEDCIGGHGWHRYEASSESGVTIVLEHNINGRAVYAAGALRACAFALKKWQGAERGRAFDMVDVIKEKEGRPTP